MRCAELEPLLSEYADGMADERGRRIVERHIQLCRACHDCVLLARQLAQQITRLSLLPLGIADRAPRLRRQLEHKLLRNRRTTINTVAIRTLLSVILCVVILLLGMLVLGVGIAR